MQTNHAAIAAHAGRIVEKLENEARTRAMQPGIMKATPRYDLVGAVLEFEAERDASGTIRNEWFHQIKGRPATRVSSEEARRLITKSLRAIFA